MKSEFEQKAANATFQSRIGKEAWLLEVAGQVYLCRSHNRQDALELQKRVAK